MIDISQLVDEILAVDAEVSDILNKLERERSEIANSINKVQGTFSNQQSGSMLASTLLRTIQKIVAVDGTLCITRDELQKYIQRVQR